MACARPRADCACEGGLLEGFGPFILIAAGGAWIWSFLVGLAAFALVKWARRRASSAASR